MKNSSSPPPNCSRIGCPYYREGDGCSCARTPSNLNSPDKLPVGACADVKFICSRNPALYNSLSALGIVAGTSLQMVRCAPLGDPLIVKVRGYDLALRLAEAREIELEMPANTNPVASGTKSC